MPTEILILLVVAGCGVVASIILMVCNAALGRRIATEDGLYAEDYAFDEAASEPEWMDAAAPEPVREIKFTPLGEEPETQRTPGAPEEEPEDEQDEPATAAPLHLVKPEVRPRPEPIHQAGSGAVVGDIALSVGNAQDIGMRAQQQDAFAITPLEEALVVRGHGVMAVVCDGMGGMENGAEAANMGAIQFMRAYLAADSVDESTLLDAVYRANDAVYRAFQGQTGAIAGTTLVAASVLPDGLRFVSVGDSHIYLFRKGKLYLLNRDHNYFSELLEEVKAGRMTLEDAQRHPERAHLTSFVGIEKLELVDYNVAPVPLRPGDRVLLCSDGLFKTLSLSEITQIIAASRGQMAQDDLLRAVKAKGKRKQDNVTLVMLYCDAN